MNDHSPLHPARFSHPAGYVAAVVFTAFALLLDLSVSALYREPFVLFLAAVSLTAWMGGFGPSVLATILSSVAGNFFFLEPAHSFSLKPHDLVRTATLAFVGLLISSITKQRERSENALKNSEDRLRLAIETSGLGTFELDFFTQAIAWSERAKQIYGLTSGTGVVLSVFVDMVHPDDREHMEAAGWAAALPAGNGRYETEFRVIRPDGGLVWIAARGQVYFEGEGAQRRPARLIGTILDVTQRKLAEESLRRSEKLAAAGRLAATVAHEVNNPLESVTNLLFLLKDELQSTAGLEYLATAERELARVAHITKQTLGFYRDTAKPAWMDAAELLDEVVSLYAPRLRDRDIAVERQYSQHPLVFGLRGELKQVFSNLIVNAADAMGQHGMLRLCVGAAKKGPEDALEVKIGDTGPGIPENSLPRLFEPFYTTKKDVGTGLGLWVSKGIVEKHGGVIAVSTTTGNGSGPSGTTFSIVLPAVPKINFGLGKSA